MSEPATLLETALSLPEEERSELALRLVESLDVAPEEDAESAWTKEVADRVEALRAGRAETIPLDRAIENARGRLRGLRG
jgi:putative addiction module component (TIGR02574 family)